MKVQCLLQKFTSCRIVHIAQDMGMLHIKIFISNAVQKTIQTKQKWRICWPCANKTDNKQPHFCAAFQMSTFTEQPASLLSTFCYPLKNKALPSDSLSRPSPLRDGPLFFIREVTIFGICRQFFSKKFEFQTIFSLHFVIKTIFYDHFKEHIGFS